MSLGYTGPPGARQDYEVTELLTQVGGQGYMMRARLHGDRLGGQFDGAEIALKQLFTGAVGAERIDTADRALRPRTHPHLSRQLEVFAGPPPHDGIDPRPDDGDHDDDVTYVAAVWVPGTTITQRAAGARLEEILRWVRQVATALDFLHSAVHDGGAVCHRDVKPSNIIITPDGDAVLIDPGLARPAGLRGADTPHGSPGYIPPECRRDRTSTGPAGDRWQLGATLYAVLTGEPPGAEPRDRMAVHLRKALRTADQPAALGDALLGMLAAQPDARPASATEWAIGLERLASRGGRRRRRPLNTRPRQWLAAAAALGVVTSGALAAEMTDPDGRARVVLSGSGTPMPRNSLAQRGPTAVSRPVTVYDKVTDGAAAMREDSPAYLATIPADYCKRDGCAVPGTDMGTGTEVTASCQTVAAVTTNGDDTTTIDQHNPGRWTSDRWYGIRLPDGRFGYLSEVWLAPEDRGGMGLPQC